MGLSRLRLHIEIFYALQTTLVCLKSEQPIHAKSIVSPFYATVASLEAELVSVA